MYGFHVYDDSTYDDSTSNDYLGYLDCPDSYTITVEIKLPRNTKRPEALIYHNLKIVNYAPAEISNEELKEFLDLVPEKYTCLPTTITIHINKNKAMEDYINDYGDIFKYINIREGGNYITINNKIRIFVFNLLRLGHVKLTILHIVLHELRHRYQHQHAFNLTKKQTITTIDMENCLNKNIESDANSFASYIMEKHKSKINNIININNDWKVGHNSLIIDGKKII